MSLPSGSLGTTSPRMAAMPAKSVHKQIFRALLTLSSAALLIRVMGILNQIAVTRRFGAGPTMDAYFVASTLPLLMATLLSTSIESSVIPVYTRVRAQGKEQASILFSTLLNLLVLGTALLTLVMFTFRAQLIHLSAPALDPLRTTLAVSLAPFIFPALLLMVVISFLECILNAEGQFGWPAYAGLLVPLTRVLLAQVLGKSEGVVILSIGMLAGLCLQLCVVIVRARRAGLVYRFSINLRNPELRSVLMVAWVAPFSVLLSQASPLVDQVFASSLSAGSISALNYALKLVSVFTGVIFVSVGRAALPYLSQQAFRKDMKAFKETLRFYLWLVGIGTTVLAALMLVLAHPLVHILFQRGAFLAADTNRTASTLVGFVVGLTPMALGFIIARAFVALRKNRFLLVTTIFGVITNAIFDYIFARLWQGTGIALATSAVYSCNLFTLLLMTCMHIKQAFQRMPALAVLLRYLIWALAGIGISPVGTGPFLTQWTLMLDCVAVGVLTINVLTTRQLLLKLIDALLIVAAFVSLYGIYGYFTRQNGVVDPTTSLFRIYSVFSAAPAAALFLSVVIPPAIYRASTLRGFKRLGVSTLVFTFLVAMTLTFTRSAFICVALSIIIMILFLPSRKMKISLLCSSLVLAAGVVLLATIGNISIFSRVFNQDLATLNGRTYLWQALLGPVDPTQLLGHGLGAAHFLLKKLQVGFNGVIATSPSNLFLGALYDHGIIGLTLLTLMFIVLGAGLIARMRKTTGEQRVLFTMALAVFVNVILQSFDANDFLAQSIGNYFWIGIALPIALFWSTTKQSSRTHKEALDEETEPRVEAVQQENRSKLLVPR